MITIADHWREMVTVALLGTDRREAPAPMPGVLADLAADSPEPTPSQRLLQQVAACTAIRRAGVLPGPAAAPPAPPQADPRPITPPAVTATWRRIMADWPVLEDEWLLTVIANGWRLAPELVVPVLGRHRGDATRHARALLAAGPLGQWMIEWSPRLAGTARQPASAQAVAGLPDLAISPELAALLGAQGTTVADAVGAALSAGTLGVAHRAVLVNFVARVRADALPALAVALDTVDPTQPAIGLAFALADLARLRHQLLTELEPA